MEMTPEEKFRQEVAAELESGNRVVEHEEDADPWAGVNPTLKVMFDNMQAKVAVLDETQTRLKQAESRIGAMTNEFYAAKKAAEGMAAAPSPEQIADAAKSDEDWESLKSEFPEWADATDRRMNMKIAAVETRLRKELSSAGTDPAAIQQEVAKLRGEYQRDLVSVRHPGWEQIITTPEYRAWLQDQPESVKEKVKSEKAVDAIFVLDAYGGKAPKTAAEIAEDRKKRMRDSVNPQGQKAVPLKSESDMTEAELRATIAAEVFAR